MALSSDQLIQDLVYYAASRFGKILSAMDKLRKGEDKPHFLNWMQSCLSQEVVRSFFLFGVEKY